jgi:peroxiredoxin
MRANAEEGDDASEDKKALPGHSFHADAFNEGPRQAAYLMPGMGNVHWQTTTPSPMAQRFFDQGLSQLHGFWYFEAERSFRQAAAIDPDCAIHYWGMARANIENPERSEGFIQQAMRRIETASKLERRLIEAWNARVQNWPNNPEDSKSTDNNPADNNATAPASKASKKRRSSDASDEVRNQRKERLKQYAKTLEEIALDYRDDIEVKAMLVLQYWQNQGEGIEIQSHAAIDALLAEIFRMNPRHPAHHFRIHLWDYRKEELALTAAAQCGPSAPGIAHMWHMPGHTYSRLNRYADAAWQQEASARVDHAHMIRDVVMPDQIHNYAHNNEWLIRNWIYLGKVAQAVSLAKNMIELPRHPNYNMVDGSGSASYGRQRLFGVLTTYQRWQELADACESAYLRDQDDPVTQDTNNAWRASAFSQLGQIDVAKSMRQEFADLRASLRKSMVDLDAESTELGVLPPKLEEPYAPPSDLFGSEDDPSLPRRVKKEFDEDAWKDKPAEKRERAKKHHELQYRYYRLGIGLAAIDAYLAASQGDYRAAVRRSHEARGMVDSMQRMEWGVLAGEYSVALKKIREHFKASPGQILPAALAAWSAHLAIQGQPQSNELKEWEELRKEAIEKCSALADGADRDVDWVNRVQPIAAEVMPDVRWASPPSPPKDLGDRPPLDALGPVRWHPPLAPMWSVTLPNGEERSSKQLAGKPYVLILYLGFGCLHCAEQLGKFSPEMDRFREAGINVIGISTETPSSLAEGLQRYEKEMRIPLASNSNLDVFKALRCFDDFEGQPLHGTIFVDGSGHIRWQDIGYEPFMDVDFVLNEAQRLLQISEPSEKSPSRVEAAQAAR